MCVCVCVCIVEYMRISEHALSSERTLLSHALLYADASACSYADGSACSSLAERTLHRMRFYRIRSPAHTLHSSPYQACLRTVSFSKVGGSVEYALSRLVARYFSLY